MDNLGEYFSGNNFMTRRVVSHGRSEKNENLIYEISRGYPNVWDMWGCTVVELPSGKKRDDLSTCFTEDAGSQAAKGLRERVFNYARNLE